MHRLTWRAPLAAALLALGAVSFSPVSLAASGTALGVNPAAELESQAATKTLTVGTDVFIGDLVKTGAEGQVQIKFTDQTELVVGPNSALLIEDYLLRQDETPGKFAINALSGTFRFSTGRAPKDRYIIQTPTGTIGVRGTAFDFDVEGGETQLLLYHGEAILCSQNQNCVTVDETCELGQATTSQSQIVGNTDELNRAERDAVKSDFIYAVSQAALLGQFRVEEAKECFQKGFVRGAMTEVLVEGGTGGWTPPADGGDGRDGGPYDPYPDDDFGPDCYDQDTHDFLCN